MNISYDLVIGGCGLFGATLGHLATKRGKRVLIIEKDKIGGMCADNNKHSLYGVHIFHTSDAALWRWANSFSRFKQVHYSPLVRYKDELYSFPINLLTLHQIYGITSKEQAEKLINTNADGRNFEEKAINAMGRDLYEKFFYHYTKKMWGCDPSLIPGSVLSRIPIRLDYNTSYFGDSYVGVPEFGYSHWIRAIASGCEIVYGDFIQEHGRYNCTKVFTGSADLYHSLKLGELPYRGLRFEKSQETPSMAINYTDEREYTREINYAYLGGEGTFREHPDDSRFYPVPWGKELHQKYLDIPTDVVFAGRLGDYKYTNMDETILNAQRLWSLIRS